MHPDGAEQCGAPLVQEMQPDHFTVDVYVGTFEEALEDRPGAAAAGFGFDRPAGGLGFGVDRTFENVQPFAVHKLSEHDLAEILFS